jgi:PTH2 family peptidyl-tRNA hydrolase
MTDEEPLRIWWNKNLHGKISPGKLAAHAAHAALAAYGIEYTHPIVVLAAGKAKIEAMPIRIHDAGHTELEEGTLTTGVADETHRRALNELLAEAWDAGHQAPLYRSNLNGDYLGAVKNPYRQETQR